MSMVVYVHLDAELFTSRLRWEILFLCYSKHGKKEEGKAEGDVGKDENLYHLP